MVKTIALYVIVPLVVVVGAILVFAATRPKLDFFKPFEAHNTAEFRLEPRGGSTNVTWAMYGPNLFIGKVMSVFINMDRMIGNDFETGLANLKALTEKPAAGAS